MIVLLESMYFVSILSFLGGLKFLSNPQKAKLGNTIAAIGMIGALIISIIATKTDGISGINYLLISIMLLVGAFLGKYMSDKVEMTEMPQLVSFFNATGGACAFLLGISEASQVNDFSSIERAILLLGAITGAIAASGSIVALRKLSGKQKDKKSLLLNISSKLALIAIILITVAASLQWFNLSFLEYTLIVVGISLIYGGIFVLPIGELICLS